MRSVSRWSYTNPPGSELHIEMGICSLEALRKQGENLLGSQKWYHLGLGASKQHLQLHQKVNRQLAPSKKKAKTICSPNFILASVWECITSLRNSLLPPLHIRISRDGLCLQPARALVPVQWLWTTEAPQPLLGSMSHRLPIHTAHQRFALSCPHLTARAFWLSLHDTDACSDGISQLHHIFYVFLEKHSLCTVAISSSKDSCRRFPKLGSG